MGPTNQPQRIILPDCLEPPSPCTVILRCIHRPRHSLGHQRQSAQCRGAANTARRLLFVVPTSFHELSKTAFNPFYWPLVRPHVEFAKEANTSTLSSELNLLECLTARLVRGLRNVPYAERFCQLNHFSVERRRLHLYLHFFARSTNISEALHGTHPHTNFFLVITRMRNPNFGNCAHHINNAKKGTMHQWTENTHSPLQCRFSPVFCQQHAELSWIAKPDNKHFAWSYKRS